MLVYKALIARTLLYLIPIKRLSTRHEDGILRS